MPRERRSKRMGEVLSQWRSLSAKNRFKCGSSTKPERGHMSWLSLRKRKVHTGTDYHDVADDFKEYISDNSQCRSSSRNHRYKRDSKPDWKPLDVSLGRAFSCEIPPLERWNDTIAEPRVSLEVPENNRNSNPSAGEHTNLPQSAWSKAFGQWWQIKARSGEEDRPIPDQLSSIHPQLAESSVIKKKMKFCIPKCSILSNRFSGP